VSPVQQFLAGRAATVIAEVVEVESGSKNDRPKLQEARAACQRNQATLLIAKLDRLFVLLATVAAGLSVSGRFGPKTYRHPRQKTARER